jgi:hypothetical protein
MLQPRGLVGERGSTGLSQAPRQLDPNLPEKVKKIGHEGFIFNKLFTFDVGLLGWSLDEMKA